MIGRHNSEASLDTVTGILKFHSHDVYALMDTSSILSYMTPYVVMKFSIEPEQLLELLSIFTPIGDSIVATWV